MPPTIVLIGQVLLRAHIGSFSKYRKVINKITKKYIRPYYPFCLQVLYELLPEHEALKLLSERNKPYTVIRMLTRLARDCGDKIPAHVRRQLEMYISGQGLLHAKRHDFLTGGPACLVVWPTHQHASVARVRRPPQVYISCQIGLASQAVCE